MQHRIFNQSFVAQVVSQGLLNIQFMVPIEAQSQINEWNSDQLKHTGPERWKKEIKTALTALKFHSCHGMLKIPLGVPRDAVGLKPSLTGA